jgi:hypothetical protein
MNKMSKKAQEEEHLVNIVWYIALLLVVAAIVWAALTGRLTAIWEGIVEKLRFG